jgi:hypothetical protein
MIVTIVVVAVGFSLAIVYAVRPMVMHPSDSSSLSNPVTVADSSHPSVLASTQPSTGHHPVKPAVHSTASKSNPPSTTPESVASASPKKGCAPNPHLCGYPDATNTGVPTGTVLRAVPGQVKSGPGWHWDPRGWLVATKSGAVISDISVNAAISVNAPNVTIKDSYINCTGGCNFNIIIRDRSTSASPSANNTVVEDSTIVDTSRRSAVGIDAENVRNTRILRNNISGEGAGILLSEGSSTIKGNYIHDLAICCGYHNEDFQTMAGGNVTITHNTLFNQNDQTSVLQVTQDFGPESNVTINNNLLAGGGWSIYGGDTGQGMSRPATGIRITNNRLGTIFFRRCGFFGWVTAFNRPRGLGNVMRGNFWDATGKPAR